MEDIILEFSSFEKGPTIVAQESGLNLVIMAAGKGRRFGGLKQLVGFGPGGETLIDYAIYDGLKAGTQRVVLVISPENRAEFQSRIVTPWSAHIEVQLVAQELEDLPVLPVDGPGPAARTKPWGTGQALWAARHAADGPMVVCNADDFYGHEAYHQMGQFFQNSLAEEEFALQGYELLETLPTGAGYSRGFCAVSPDGYLEGIEEQLEVKRDEIHAAGQLVSMNFWGFTPLVFSLLERAFQGFLSAEGANPESEFYLPAAIQAGLDSNKCRVMVQPPCGRWFGVTNPEDAGLVREHLIKLHEDGTYPEDLLA